MMKRLLLLAIPVALLTAACGSSGEDMLTSNAWKATGIAGPDGSLEAPIGGSSPSLGFEGDTAGGNASCNQFFGSFELSGSKLSFGMLASTEMFCGDPGVMEQEEAYLAALGSVDGWSIDDDVLSLTSGDATVVTYDVLSQDLAGTSWELLGYNNGTGGFQSVTGEQPVTAAFSDDGTVAGSAGCNDYNTTYETTDDGAIEFGVPASTRMMCADNAVMEQEARYLQVLELVDNYQVGVDSLEMFDAEGLRLLQYLPSGE